MFWNVASIYLSYRSTVFDYIDIILSLFHRFNNKKNTNIGNVCFEYTLSYVTT